MRLAVAQSQELLHFSSIMKRALVTGGAGFIGSHVVERLVREGWQVKILDNLSSGSHENLLGVSPIEVIEGDIRDIDTCYCACRDVDCVFHLAAISSVASSIAAPLTTHDINLGGTLNILCAARDMHVKRFVFSSSASIYGNAETIPTTENQQMAPQSPYASSKACAEFYCRNFFDLHGLEAVVLRYFNVFGPRQSANSGYAAVIPLFVQAAVTGRTPTVYGDGLQTRDFVYVESVAEANWLAATMPQAAGKTFNVAGGTGISLIDLLQTLERITGKDMAPEFQPGRPGEVRHSRADITAARQFLRFQPRITLTEGLKRTLASALPETSASSAHSVSTLVAAPA
ncbi:MAG TPA: NAD-dependent epimerase/dehydratase family protein [Capsulimonadaceae bacterium]|nr:NAD-dependent epimerase/dehydratase family protein [Capsulimonadaceae bacterium]